MAIVDQRELLSLLKESRELIDFNPENCDFGPAYGLHKMRLAEWKKRVDQVLLQNRNLLK